MYCTTNFRTKKQLKEAVAAGEMVTIFQYGGVFNLPENSPNYTGKAYLGGPHYPAPHTWYAQAELTEL